MAAKPGKFGRVFRPAAVDPQQMARAEAAAAAVERQDAPPRPAGPALGALQTAAAPAVAPGAGAVRGVLGTPELGALQTAPATWQAGQTVLVPHERIRANPLNPRVFYLADSVNALAESMAVAGQTTPATGYLDGEHVVLIEGHTRQRAARQLGWEALRVELRPQPADLRALYEQAHTANDARSNPSPLDDAVRWAQLLAEKIYTSQRALAIALRKDEGEVSRTLALNELPPSLLQSLAEARSLHTGWTLRAVLEFWKSCGDDETHKLIVEAKQNHLSGREIKRREQVVKAGATTRPRSNKDELIFRSGKGQISTFPDGRVMVSMKGLSVEDAQAFKQRLIKALSH